MGLINNFFETVKAVLSQPPHPSPCTGNCNQGRNCTCCGAKTESEEATVCPNWPFPCDKKP